MTARTVFSDIEETGEAWSDGRSTEVVVGKFDV